MNASSIIAILLVGMLTAGCATPYQQGHPSHYFTLGGYVDARRGPDTFSVYFHGNLYASGDRIKDFALLRATELTLLNNSKYLALMDIRGCGMFPSDACPLSANRLGMSTGALSE